MKEVCFQDARLCDFRLKTHLFAVEISTNHSCVYQKVGGKKHQLTGEDLTSKLSPYSEERNYLGAY